MQLLNLIRFDANIRWLLNHTWLVGALMIGNSKIDICFFVKFSKSWIWALFIDSRLKNPSLKVAQERENEFSKSQYLHKRGIHRDCGIHIEIYHRQI